MATVIANDTNSIPTIRVRDPPLGRSSIQFGDEYTPINKPPIAPAEKITLGNHSNVYHPSQLHAGHHRKPSPAPSPSTIKAELVNTGVAPPVTVFTATRRPSASPVPDNVRDIFSGSPSTTGSHTPSRKPCPSPSTTHATNIVVHHDTRVFTPVETHHKKQSSHAAEQSTMKSLVNQVPTVETSARRVRASPGGTDSIILG